MVTLFTGRRLHYLSFSENNSGHAVKGKQSTTMWCEASQRNTFYFSSITSVCSYCIYLGKNPDCHVIIHLFLHGQFHMINFAQVDFTLDSFILTVPLKKTFQLIYSYLIFYFKVFLLHTIHLFPWISFLTRFIHFTTHF